jgi:hypothetical protein
MSKLAASTRTAQATANARATGRRGSGHPRARRWRDEWSRFARSRRPTIASAVARRRDVTRHGAREQQCSPRRTAADSHRERDRGSRAANPLRKQSGSADPAEDGWLAPAWRRTAPCSDETRGPGFELARSPRPRPESPCPHRDERRTPAEGADPEGPERHPETEKARGKAAKTTELLRATREPSLFSAPERAAEALAIHTARFALATVRR